MTVGLNRQPVFQIIRRHSTQRTSSAKIPTALCKTHVCHELIVFGNKSRSKKLEQDSHDKFPNASADLVYPVSTANR